MKRYTIQQRVKQYYKNGESLVAKVCPIFYRNNVQNVA